MPSDSEEIGLAAPGSASLVLRPDATPTSSYMDDPSYLNEIKSLRSIKSPAHEDAMLGPFFRWDAPYRAKLSSPHEPGKCLVIKGRVWAYDDKTPLPAIMDVWQTDAIGRYDNEEEAGSPAKQEYINRARVRCDETGYYEFETVHPGPHQMMNCWRAPHINFRVRYPGYKTLVTQLFFKGDPYLDADPYVKASLIIPLRERERYGVAYEEGVFDIVISMANE